MKSAAIVVAFAILIGIGMWLVWPRDTVEFRKQHWFSDAEELRGAKRNRSVAAHLRHELSRLVRGCTDYDQIMRQHERALFRLGYLPQHNLFLTNQVLAREFSSNFCMRIRRTFGTNGETIWSYGSFTYRDGIHATLPVQDLTRWEAVFRECAERYASNLPLAALQ